MPTVYFLFNQKTEMLIIYIMKTAVVTMQFVCTERCWLEVLVRFCLRSMDGHLLLLWLVCF